MNLTEAQKKIGDAVILERAARVLLRRWPENENAVAAAIAWDYLAGKLRKEAEHEHAAGPDGQPGPDDHGRP